MPDRLAQSCGINEEQVMSVAGAQWNGGCQYSVLLVCVLYLIGDVFQLKLYLHTANQNSQSVSFFWDGG